MKIAVIKTGGKQYIAHEDALLTIEKLPGDPQKGDKVVFDEVLMTDDGTKTEIGTPTVSGAKVEGEVIGAGKAPKKIVFRYKPKSNRTKLKGHRQPFTKVKITSV
ncbi:MAG: 50S ribosomal protein L21 [Patescibacteria group bacterium UBA2163]